MKWTSSMSFQSKQIRIKIFGFEVWTALSIFLHFFLLNIIFQLNTLHASCDRPLVAIISTRPNGNQLLRTKQCFPTTSKGGSSIPMFIYNTNLNRVSPMKRYARQHLFSKLPWSVRSILSRGKILSKKEETEQDSIENRGCTDSDKGTRSQRIPEIDFKSLSTSQKSAVHSPCGPTRVVAGPGSGKTRVLTYRIAYLLTEEKVKPWNILAVTFTNKAATELKTRLENLFCRENHRDDQKVNANPYIDLISKLTVGTFHSVCVKLLRYHGAALNDLPSGEGLDGRFTISDTEDGKRLLKKLIKEKTFSKNDGEDKIKPETIRSAISFYKSRGILVHGELSEEINEGDWGWKDLKLSEFIYFAKRYQEELQASNMLDFDDIILIALELLKYNKEARHSAQEKWKHVLIDEWQDTSLLQYELIQYLSPPSDSWIHPSGQSYLSRSLMVVGDTDQSIYGWRGADVMSLTNFEKEYSNCMTCLLEDNYRSTETITTAAQAIVSKAKQRVAKTIKALRTGGNPVVIVHTASDDDESRFVCKQIMKFALSSSKVEESRSSNEESKSIAIIYRTNAQSRSFEQAFLSVGIPYRLVGAQKFFARREIKDTIAFLRLIANPMDVASMKRIINVPPRKIGDVTSEEFFFWCEKVRSETNGRVNAIYCLFSMLDKDIIDNLIYRAQKTLEGTEDCPTSNADEISLLSLNPPSLVEDALSNISIVETISSNSNDSSINDINKDTSNIPNSGTEEEKNPFMTKREFDELREKGIQELSQRGRKAIQPFAKLMGEILLASRGKSMEDLLAYVIDIVGLKSYYLDRAPTVGEGEDRVRNLEELIKTANRFSSRVAAKGELWTYLEDVSLMEDTTNNLENQNFETKNSKIGTYQPVNLLTAHSSKGLEFDTVFLTGLEAGTFPLEGRGKKGDEEIDEERRLMYVAMTRAKDSLFISWRSRLTTYAQGGGLQTRTSYISPFLNDIPKDVTKKLATKEAYGLPKDNPNLDPKVGSGKWKTSASRQNSKQRLNQEPSKERTFLSKEDFIKKKKEEYVKEKIRKYYAERQELSNQGVRSNQSKTSLRSPSKYKSSSYEDSLTTTFTLDSINSGKRINQKERDISKSKYISSTSPRQGTIPAKKNKHVNYMNHQRDGKYRTSANSVTNQSSATPNIFSWIYPPGCCVSHNQWGKGKVLSLNEKQKKAKVDFGNGNIIEISLAETGLRRVKD